MINYTAIVIGVSAGGMTALKTILFALPADFALPIIIVQHVNVHSDSIWITLLDRGCKLLVKEAEEKETIEKGVVYIAPPNYHLLVEKDQTFSLSIEQRVNYARPSIDVLFESAAEVYREKLIGIILTGANNDGSKGMKRIKEYGGLTIVQNPLTAESKEMPESCISIITPDHILPLEDITGFLVKEISNKLINKHN